MRASGRRLFLQGLVVALGSSLLASVGAAAKCAPTIGPSVRFGSLGLSPTVKSVAAGTTVPLTLTVLTFPVTSSPPIFELSFRSGGKVVTAKMTTFELCVFPNVPYPAITTVLEQPGPADPSAQSWQFFFGGVFINPLKNNPSPPVTRVDVDAPNLNSAIPAGVQPYGEMLITILLKDGPHKLDLTVQRK
jgi:hypothetical protein